MGIYDQILADDSRFFCDPDLMPGTEAVIYTPKGGTGIIINVMVERNPNAEVLGVEKVSTPFMDVWIPNNAIYGTTAINTNGDTLTIATRQGGVAKPLVINEIVSQDAGMWHVRLR